MKVRLIITFDLGGRNQEGFAHVFTFHHHTDDPVSFPLAVGFVCDSLGLEGFGQRHSISKLFPDAFLDRVVDPTLLNNPVPPSLQNIFKEIQEEYKEEYGAPINRNPDLTRWAEQGVLLLNASLSVRSGLANSHVDYGWHHFTDAVITAISDNTEHVVFLLWGSFAGKKAERIDAQKHLILTASHPSPLSAHASVRYCNCSPRG